MSSALLVGIALPSGIALAASPRSSDLAEHHLAQHEHPAQPPPKREAPQRSEGHAGHAAEGAHAAHEAHAMATMPGLYGPYSMTRESSGTAWQPDAAAHHGIHRETGPWRTMLHGFATAVYDNQGGPRGDEKVVSTNMLMGNASRPLGGGRFGARAMLSLEPLTIGKKGYPLLLQTGETADGETHLIDRQHPHDLFMELAGTYSISRGARSAFLYVGFPGEPALGPPVFMHRFSGEASPEAPITHHWLDSTHITYGVVTAGAVAGNVKLEASVFTGREPDEERYGFDSPDLDSHAFRLSVNPSARWALQASFGRIESPEQLEPDIDTDRTTLSAIYSARGEESEWQGTIAWGRNENRPGRTLDAFLVEAAIEIEERHTLFARGERVEKDELFAEGDSLEGAAFTVGKVSAGYIYEAWRATHVAGGIGGLASVAILPEALEPFYDESPFSVILFVRGVLR